jgi:nucleotide-binding universal stress UspA family protein
MLPVLVGYDGSATARDALRLGAGLARALAAGLEVVHVEPAAARAAGVLGEARLHEARNVLGDPARTTYATILAPSPATGLVRHATLCGARLVVVGSSARGAIGRALAGSVAQELMTIAPCPVATAPRGFAEGGHQTAGRVLVAWDDTPESEAALAAAVDIARRTDAPLELVEVVAPGEGKAAGERLDAVVASLGAPGMTARSVLTGAPSDLLGVLRPSDLLVLGSPRYGPLLRRLLGRADHPADPGYSPVLVVPRAGQEAVLAA